jgi:hypothetical protein
VPSMLVSFPKSAPMMNLSQYVARFSFPMRYKVLLIQRGRKLSLWYLLSFPWL